MAPQPQARLRSRVERFIAGHRLVQPGERVLIACSGGPDSTALLYLLHSLAPGLHLQLGVVHVDHRQYRGSPQASDFVKERCRRLKIPFHACSLGEGRLPPGSNEAACRMSRYQVFREVARVGEYQRIATGHTRNDQVETILMRIVRGTGTFGLGGIPIKRGRYIRPLLGCDREEILDYLKSRRLRWLLDPSNRSRRFVRNRIRHEVLPGLRAVNPAVDAALLRLARAAARDNDLLTRMTACLETLDLEAGVALDLPRIENLHDAVLARVVLKMLRRLLPPGANVEQLHLDRLLCCLRAGNHGPTWSVDLPGGVDAGVEDGRFLLRRGHRPAAAPFRIEVPGPGEVLLPEGRGRLRFHLQQGWEPERASPTQVFFDAEEVDFPLTVRSLESGDRLRPWGGAGSHKVARLLMDAKVPRHLRLAVPLLVRGKDILWVAGVRRSDAAPAGSGTVLSVELMK